MSYSVPPRLEKEGVKPRPPGGNYRETDLNSPAKLSAYMCVAENPIRPGFLQILGFFSSRKQLPSEAAGTGGWVGLLLHLVSYRTGFKTSPAIH